MANLGGKITLDISEFQSKIQEANRLIRENESAWRSSASKMADWTKSEDGLKSRMDSLTKQIDYQQEIIDVLTQKKEALIVKYGKESKEVDRCNQEIIRYSKQLESSKKQQDTVRKAIDNYSDSVDENKSSLEKNTEATKKSESQTKSLNSVIVKCNNNFTVLKTTVANLASTAITSLIKSIKQVINLVDTLPEQTRTLRRTLNQISTSFSDVGFSTDTATQSYIEYSSVLGTVDSNASTTVSLLASLSSNTSDLSTWTTTLTGIYAKLGTAIPTNELTKNIQQTANTGKMTENLTKVLQSAGVNVDTVETNLTKLNTTEERAAYLLSVLNTEYGTLGSQYITNNKQIIEADKSQLRLNTAWSKFGDMLEPLKTKVTNTMSGIVEALYKVVQGQEGASGELAYNIGYLAGTIAGLWDDIYEGLEPYLVLLKNKITEWFDNNKQALLDKFKDWLTGVFGEDAVKEAENLAGKIIEPIKTLFADIKNGDYEKALGDSLPVITIGVGLSLLSSALTDLPGAISKGLSTAFTGKSLTMAGAVAGLVGVISLGIELKDAMKTGDYKAWAEKALTSILDGLAVFGVTGSLTMGAFAFALSATLDISAVEFAEKAKEKLGLSDVTMSVVPVLSMATLSGIKTSLTDGLSAGIGKAWKSAGVASAVLGIVDIGLEFKDAMQTGDYSTVCENMINALVAGFAVAGITGSVTAGAIVFNLVAQMDVSIPDLTKSVKEKLDVSDVEIAVGLSLATGAVTGIISGIKSGFSTALPTAWKKAGISAAIIGALQVGIELSQVQTQADMQKLVEDIIVALVAAGAVYGLTWSASASLLTFTVALNLDIGSQVVNKWKTWGEDIAAILNGTPNKTYTGTDGTKLWDLTVSGNQMTATSSKPLQLDINGVSVKTDADIYKDLQDEIIGLLDGAVDPDSYKSQLQNVMKKAGKQGKQIAEAIADGYGIEIGDLSEMSEIEARLVIEKMREVLGIHSPSTEATYIAEMWTAGFEDGLAGLPNKFVEAAQDGVDGTKDVVDKGVQTVTTTVVDGAEKAAGEVKSVLSEALDEISGIFDSYDKENGSQSIYDSLFSAGTTALKSAGGIWSLVGIILDVVKQAMDSDENAEKYLEEFANDLIEGFMKLLDDLPKIVKLALQFIKALVQGLIKALPELLKKLPEIVAEIIKEFLNMLPDFVWLGCQLIEGLAKGIWEGIKSIGNVIWDAGCQVVDWFKDVFGIASPSKVMKREVGRNLALGVVEGLNENLPLINRAIQGVNTTLSFGGAVGTGTASNGKIINVNQYNTYSKSYSAYELYKSERAIKQMVGAY